MENLKMKRKKEGQKILTFRSGDLNPRFSVIFPPMILIFMESEGDEIKSKQASKKDRTLPNSVCENSNLTSSLSFSVRALSRRICSFSSSDSSVCIFILKSVISRSCRSFSSLRSFSARSRCSRSCRYRLFSFRRYFFK